MTVALTSGQVVSGVKVAETDQLLTLGDDQGKIHEIAKADIDERKIQTRSTMPDGLEKRLSDRDFLDLVAFLAAQKKAGPP
jgi:putative heme-binding domain-containing protein